jgi:hypothetical protein
MLRSIGFLIITLGLSLAPTPGRTAVWQQSTVYVCPMHPEVQSSKPGECPKCGMQLVVKSGSSAGPVSDKSETSTAAGSTRGAAPPALTPPADTYTCPMHPEIRLSAPGKCPKCGMTLVPATPAIAGKYALEMECEPITVKPNEEVRLRFVVLEPGTGRQVTQFAPTHTKLFHLFIVSQDMAHFQHIHPQLEPDGSFTIKTVLPQPGHYKVYSDIYPSAGTPQVIQRDLVTSGYHSNLFASQPRLSVDTGLSKTVDGMKIDLKLDPEEIIAGRPATLKYHLTDARTGAPVRDLKPYLGAWGHTLVLSQDQVDYVHSHPTENVPEDKDPATLNGGPDVVFEAFLPRPATYRLWTQFQRGDKLTTVSFTIRAVELH